MESAADDHRWRDRPRRDRDETGLVTIRRVTASVTRAAAIGAVAWIWGAISFSADSLAASDSAAVGDDPTEAMHDLPAILATQPPGAKPAVSVPGLLQLKTLDGDPDLDSTNENGMIFRELVRQALLLTAREELGLATRDQSLREPFWDLPGTDLPGTADDAAAEDADPVNSPLGSIQVVSSIRGRLDDAEDLRITIFMETADGAEAVWEQAVPIPMPKWHAVETLSDRLEKLARGDFRAQLMELGFEGKRNAWDESGEVPDAVLQMASRWNPLSQYLAIRALHRLMRDEGESPRRLAELSRAYARLGTMTQHHWGAAHVAWKARALLYSQRLAVRTGGSVEARQARAYALAFVGRPESASNVQLRRLKEAEGGWTPEMQVLDAFCNFDPDALESLAERPDLRPLVRYVQYLTEEHVSGSTWVDPIMMRTLETLPECYGALDVLARGGNIGTKRFATSEASRRFAETVRRRLGEAANVPGIDALPPGVLDRLDPPSAEIADFPIMGGWDPAEFERRREIVSVLKTAGTADRQEPSWGALGQLISEESFVHAARVTHFYRYAFGMDGDEFDQMLEPLEPLFADHPYAFGLRTYWRPKSELKDELEGFIDTLDRAELTAMVEPMASHFSSIDNAAWKRLMVPAVIHLSPLYRDFVLRMVKGSGWAAERNSLQLERIAPRSPMQAYGNLRHRWHVPRIASLAGPYEESFGYHPRVLQQLAFRYQQREEWEAAERVLVRWVEVEPSLLAYMRLADHQQARGAEERWLEVMETFLRETTPVALSHASAQDKIARYWMSREEFERALPYAEQAAESWAAWAMLTASACNELLGRDERAERWMRRISERYLTSSTDWYHWCRRTGAGDVRAAEDFAETRIDRLIERGTVDSAMKVAHFRHAMGVPEIAAGIFEEQYRRSGRLSCGILAALIWDELRQPERRDNLFQQIVDGDPGQGESSKWLHEFVKQIRVALRADEELADFNTGAIDRLIDSAPDGTPTMLHSYLGRLLWHRGRRDLAERYLTMAATSTIDTRSRDIAGSMLRDHGIDPGPIRTYEPRPKSSASP